MTSAYDNVWTNLFLILFGLILFNNLYRENIDFQILLFILPLVKNVCLR